jgi:hypothetical protein
VPGYRWSSKVRDWGRDNALPGNSYRESQGAVKVYLIATVRDFVYLESHMKPLGIEHTSLWSNRMSCALLSIYLSIYLRLCSPLLDLGRFFSFLILYTVGRTPWTGKKPIARPLPTHIDRTTHTHRINTHIHPCLEWDSNPWFQISSGRRRFIP